MDTIAGWLASLGLADYETLFTNARVDLRTLVELTERDLTAMGISSVGHRRKLVRAITERRVSLPKTEGGDSNPRDGISAKTKFAAERRQITAVFCDIVGSTALFAQLDPEDTRDVLVAYQRACATVVRSYDGFVAKHLGDGILIYFGYPHAQEDDAERAVRAALDVAAAVGKLKTRSPKALRVRVGVSTGMVVVGDLLATGAANEIAVGEAPHMAFRLQAVAEPNGVVISQTTERLVKGLFDLRRLGSLALEDGAEAVEAWAVGGPRALTTRFAARVAASTKLCGRGGELEDLRDRQVRAFGGHGQAVLISGEAGVGKSRIVAELLNATAGETHVRAVYQCTARHRDTPLHPFIAQLERAAGIADTDPPGSRLDKLETLFGCEPVSAPQLVPLVAELLSIPTVGRDHEPNLAPAQRRRRLFRSLVDHLTAKAHKQPILIVVEDAHWADATTHELLDTVVSVIADLPILVVVTSRPGFQPRWAKHENAGFLALSRLDKAHATILVEQLTEGHDFPPALIRRIVAKTDGIPLFIEELTKTVIEYGEERRLGAPTRWQELPPKLAIPTTLQGSLMARLDRLTTVREVAQIGSAIGRDFSFRLLRAVAGGDEDALRAALAKLEQAELVSCAGSDGDAVYTFKHALVQDAAYESLLKGQRQHIHKQIADALCTRFPQVAEGEPEVVARHFAEAKEAARAVEWWAKAGEQALRRSAYHEARAHLENAVEAADGLAQAPAQRRLRLRLQADYGNVLIALLGHSAPETTAAFARIAESAHGVGDTSERFVGFYGVWVGSYGRGEVAKAAELAGAFAREAEASGDATAIVIGHLLVGSVRWCQGDFAGAMPPLEAALAAYDRERDFQLAFRFGQDIGVSTMIFLALALWPLGEPERARALAQAAVEHACSTGNIHTIAYGHFHKAVFEAVCNEPERLMPHAAALQEIAHEHNLPLWHAGSMFLRGWAQWHDGQKVAGEAAMRQARGLFRGSSAALAKPLFAALWAEVKGESDPATAAAALERLLAENVARGLHWFDAELHRRRAEFLVEQEPPDVSGGEAGFLRAIAIAREQRASAFEARAERALARLRAGVDNPGTEARSRCA